jgi:exopolysaccharide production protein ExoQ
LLALAFGPILYISARAAVAAMLLLALAGLAGSGLKARPLLAESARFLLPLLPLLLWMLLSAFWSFDPGGAVSLALRLAGLVLGGALLVAVTARLEPERLRWPILALVAGLAFSAGVVALDLYLGGPFAFAVHPPAPENFDPALYYGRAASLQAVFVVPLLIALVRLRAWRLGLLHTVLAACAILESASLSARMGLAVGLVALALVYALPLLRWAGLAMLALAMAAAPIPLPWHIGPEAACWLISHKASALHRIMIWNFVAEHIHERPVIGWGLDAARDLPGGKTPVELRRCPPDPHAGDIALQSNILPLHPHNGILQVWLELGGIGALLGFVPALYGMARLFRRPGWQNRLTQAMLAATLAAALAVWLFNFGLWQEWFLAGLFVAAAVAVPAAQTTGVMTWARKPGRSPSS